MAYLDVLDRVTTDWLSVFTPPPNLSVSEWADEHLYLSPEDSSEKGKYRVSRAPYQRGMMDAVSDPYTKEVVFCTSSQIGKALALDTRIPTPSGWTTMGDLQVGDKVFDERGEPCSVTFVTAVMENRPCFSVKFSDGAEIVADAEHQWYVEFDKNIGDNSEKRVLTTQHIYETQHDNKESPKKRNKYAVPVAAALNTEELDLPIDPYLLGVWLGDGFSGQAKMVCHEDDSEHFKKAFEASGHRVNKTTTRTGVYLAIDQKIDGFCKRGHAQTPDNTYQYKNHTICRKCLLDGEAVRKGRKQPQPEWVNFSRLLRQAGVWNNKHIPAKYLRSSTAQRLALLQGLMDTDGHACRKSGRSEFSTTSKQIACGMAELLSSLGVKFTCMEKQPTTMYKGEKVLGKIAYRFSFLAYAETPVFRLPRKLERMVAANSTGPNGKPRRTSETFRRRIVGVEPVASVPVKCIQVDSPSHLYLAGEKMVPTHNTLISKAVLGYYISQDPGPILMIQPTVGMAETYSKDRLAPMVRDTPALTRLIADPKSRNSGNTIDKKSFPGGHLTMVGANAPSDLAGRPIRIVFADEVDRYPASAGSEGDPLFLARQRTVTFWNRKFIMASTPTIAGISRIWRAFETSDQRYYYVPCPHCQHKHVLKWERMVWHDDDPTTARMACPKCGELYGDADKLKMLPRGEWRAHAPFRGIAGFHISALYSPWQTFADVVAEWLLKKDHPETLKTFLNLQLGECWEDRSGETLDPSSLQARREPWAAVPEDVLLLTASVDTQDDRLESTVIGWTLTEQARVIGHYKFHGNPAQPEVWTALDEFLMSNFDAADGRVLRIRATTVDTGGHHTKMAYEFCRARTGRRIVPIKGRNGAHPIWPNKASKSKLSDGLKLFLVGVDTAKDDLRAALAVRDPALPRYVSFSDSLTEDYFVQLTSEKRVTTINKKNNRSVRTWTKKKAGSRNEALDCFVYNIAALEYLKASGLRLKEVARLAAQQADKETPAEAGPMPPPTATPAKPKRARTSSAIL